MMSVYASLHDMRDTVLQLDWQTRERKDALVAIIDYWKHWQRPQDLQKIKSSSMVYPLQQNFKVPRTSQVASSVLCHGADVEPASGGGVVGSPACGTASPPSNKRMWCAFSRGSHSTAAGCCRGHCRAYAAV